MSLPGGTTIYLVIKSTGNLRPWRAPGHVMDVFLGLGSLPFPLLQPLITALDSY